MQYIVFYSWQSDLPNNLNRSFIEAALEKATKSISKDQNFSIEPVIDRDTSGVPGSPSIIETITEKIAKADLFVCDVTIVNHLSVGRKMPNPNVLFELGYASAVLGWERIIMIQNIAFGGLEAVPFDLRGRRLVDYYLDNSSTSKFEIKQVFHDKLLDIFIKVFNHHSVIGYMNTNMSVWWGNWDLKTRRKSNVGKLCIHRVSSTSFYFDINIVDGARSGKLKGKARIIAPNAAVTRIKIVDDKICEVVFRRRLNKNDNLIIKVEEGSECNFFHGQGTSFNGDYVLMPELVLLNRYLDEIDMNEINRITGHFCQDFMNCFQNIVKRETMDNAITTVFVGGAKGLYTIKESIVGLNDKGDVWCAFIDSDVVRYFTNVTTDVKRLPNTFEGWRSRFVDKKVIYSSKVSTKF